MKTVKISYGLPHKEVASALCAFRQHLVRYDGIGLPSNVIYRIEEDEKGLFWVSTNKGLVHFNPKNSSFKVYTVANGLLSNQFNYQSSYKDKNGRIYFGCINGFISFAPSFLY